VDPDRTAALLRTAPMEGDGPPALHGDIDIGRADLHAKTRRPLASPALICDPEPENGS
jgi:hypothetical protein